jgi:pimeloyl-ACP methyl ester carboxylesterase
MLLLHGHSWAGLGAKRVLPAADLFARELCVAGLAVSLPGYGDTEVDARPLEEATSQVVLDAIATAKKLPWIDAKRFYVYGFSRGAVVAAALINQMDGIKGTLLQSGAYDLPRLYRDTSSFWMRQLLNPAARLNPNCKIYFRRSPLGKHRRLSCMGHAITSFPFPRRPCYGINSKGLPSHTASSCFQSTAIGYPYARSKARRFSFSKRTALTLVQLPVLNLFHQLLGFLFVFGVV